MTRLVLGIDPGTAITGYGHENGVAVHISRAGIHAAVTRDEEKERQCSHDLSQSCSKGVIWSIYDGCSEDCVLKAAPTDKFFRNPFCLQNWIR